MLRIFTRALTAAAAKGAGHLTEVPEQLRRRIDLHAVLNDVERG